MTRDQQHYKGLAYKKIRQPTYRINKTCRVKYRKQSNKLNAGERT